MRAVLDNEVQVRLAVHAHAHEVYEVDVVLHVEAHHYTHFRHYLVHARRCHDA